MDLANISMFLRSVALHTLPKIDAVSRQLLSSFQRVLFVCFRVCSSISFASSSVMIFRF